MDTQALYDVLRQHPFLEGFKPPHVQKMAEIAHEVQFGRDHSIFREGDECGLFYLILEGKVALEVSAPGRIMRISTLGPGDELGWSSLLMKESKHFNARTLEPVRALAFDAARLRQTCEQDHGFGYLLMQQLVRVVAQRLHATRLQLLDLYAPRGMKLI
jgi:CRP/FNR family cyclic AMP-dependent transcriptional regulator